MYQYEFKKSISNTLIIIAAIVTIISMWFKMILHYGMSNEFLPSGDYIALLLQFLLYQFLHGGFWHLTSNSLFLYLFWNVIEKHLGATKYILFFLGNTIFVWVALLFLSQGITIGISGFAMAILAYYILELKRVWNPDYKWAITLLIINILIGFTSDVSFIWHFAWAIFGWIWYVLMGIIRK